MALPAALRGFSVGLVGEQDVAGAVFEGRQSLAAAGGLETTLATNELTYSSPGSRSYPVGSAIRTPPGDSSERCPELMGSGVTICTPLLVRLFHPVMPRGLPARATIATTESVTKPLSAFAPGRRPLLRSQTRLNRAGSGRAPLRTPSRRRVDRPRRLRLVSWMAQRSW